MFSGLLRHASSLSDWDGVLSRMVDFVKTSVRPDNIAMAPNALAEMCHLLADELVSLYTAIS